MSRFGKLPILIPKGVTVEVSEDTVKVTGAKGSLERKLPRSSKVVVEESEAVVKLGSSSKLALALQGTTRAHIANMVHGVSEGWKKELELVGSGYRAELRGKDLVLNVGYSHPINITAPEGITFAVEKSKITVSGIDKDVVGQISAKIRETRKPDPYKGKGVKYVDEVIRRKAGKQAAKAGAA